VRNRKLVNVCVAIFSIAVIVCVVCYIQAYNVRALAQECLNDTQRLRLGSSSRPEVERTFAKFSKFRRDGLLSTKKNDFPTREYLIINRGMHLSNFLRSSGFYVSLTFDHDILIMKGAGFAEGISPSVSTRAWSIRAVQESGLDRSPRKLIVRERGPGQRIDVELDDQTSEADQGAAFDYNLGCFTSLLGCRTVYDVLPGLHQLKHSN
jgi:hypothetical protein